MLIVVSLSSKKAAIKDYDWFKFEGKRKVALENKEYDLEVEANDVFGLRSIRKNLFHVVHRGDPDIVFACDAKIARSLLGRAKPFSGVIKGVRVKNEKTAKLAKGPVLPTGTREPTPYLTVPGSLTEDKKLTKLLHTIKLKGANRLVFIKALPMPTGEVYYYYDASDTFNEYGKSKSAKWETDLQKAAVAALKSADFLVGAGVVNHSGQQVPCLALVGT